MDGLEHQMVGVCDELFLAARIAAPEQEDDGPLMRVELLDDGVGEVGPADLAVAVGLTAAHGQGGVEQQDALLGPGDQAAGVRRGQAHIILQLGENILQAGRQRHARPHRKTQPLGLSRAVIGVLPEQDGLDVGVGRVAQGVKDVLHGRIDLVFSVLLLEDAADLCVIFRVELVRKQRVPVVSNLYHSVLLLCGPAPARDGLPASIIS